MTLFLTLHVGFSEGLMTRLENKKKYFDVGGLPLVPVGSQVVGDALRVGLHRLLARLPAGGADLAVLIGELERLEKKKKHFFVE